MEPRKTLPKTAIPRLYFIDQQIAAGKYPNVPGLAKLYETSVSSINRDIAYMRDMLNAPIKYDFFKKGFYYTEKTFRLSAAYATADDLLALDMAKNLMELYRETPIHDAAKNLLKSISAPLQEMQNAQWYKDRVIIPKTIAVRIDPDIWHKLINSLQKNLVIKFQYHDTEVKNTDYQNKKPKLAIRSVRPYQLLFDHSAWYLSGYDEDRKTKRIFALSRISNVTLTEKNFIIEENFDYRNSEGVSYFGVYAKAEAHKFIVEITGDTRWIKERQWAEDQLIKEVKNGIRISFTSNQFDKVLIWILSQGADACPIMPKILVERWSEIVREMAKNASVRH